ncbi:MAG: cytidylate kinase-like family protein [Deltaproteobacteria bacterium]|nr:cytidylate kinase-like family protein [Deltaproteobacteria bacterium]
MAILTIARQLESGGRDLGREIADRLGYELINRKMIFEEMRSVGDQWEEWARYFKERAPNVWERHDWSYQGFIALTHSHVLNHALKNRVVIMGREGNFLLKKVPYAFRIRTEAPMPFRIERLRQREEISRELARLKLEQVDEDMARSVYLVYGKDWADPEEYDHVFDMSRQPFEEIVAFVQEALLEKDRFHTPEARAILALRALAAGIKAKLVIEPTFSVAQLEVAPKEEGLVEYGLLVKGIVYNREDIQRIEEVVQRMAGRTPVEFEIRYRIPPRLSNWQYK